MFFVISMQCGITEKLAHPRDHSQILNIVESVINELERSKGRNMGRPTGHVTDHWPERNEAKTIAGGGGGAGHYSGDVKQNTLGTRATKDGPEESNYLAHFLVDFPDYRLSKDTLWDYADVIPVNTTHAVGTGLQTLYAVCYRWHKTSGMGQDAYVSAEITVRYVILALQNLSKQVLTMES